MRALSHWAWGWADQQPDAVARGRLAGQITALLNMPVGAPRTPVPIEDVRLGEATVTVPGELRSWCSTDAEDRARHTYGRAFLDQWRAFCGDFTNAPDVVARPTSEDQLRVLFEWAVDRDLVVVPYGGGTSVVRGVECSADQRRAGVVCLNMRGFDRLLAFDGESHLAHLEAGMTGPAIEAALGEHGFTLRHYPQSFEFSTLGGWLATRAGGHFATGYTHIDDLTAGIRMLTAEGQIWESGPLPGSGAGPDPQRMVLGSEGTLGAITSAWMRVRPRPRFKGSATLHFRSFFAAVHAARDLARSGLFPSNCRVLAPREAALNMVTNDGTAVLLVGFEATGRSVEPQMTQALALVAHHGGELRRPPSYREERTARDPAASSWRTAFLNGPYLQSTLLSMGIMADTFETACTWAAFPTMHRTLIEHVRGVMKAFGAPARLTCRFTHVYPDGPAPYYTFITPMTPDVATQWATIKAAASEILLAHGATITHHHAVGRAHRPWYDQQSPPPFAAALKAMKRTVDPQGLLNPGVLVD